MTDLHTDILNLLFCRLRQHISLTMSVCRQAEFDFLSIRQLLFDTRDCEAIGNWTQGAFMGISHQDRVGTVFLLLSMHDHRIPASHK